MTSLYEVTERPELDSPVLVMALDGWIDAGAGSTTAMSAITDALEAVTVATFDTDALLDHRARRPIMHLVDGLNTGLSWPSIELKATSDPAGTDMLLLVGAEPDHSWRAFSEAAVDLAMEFGTRLVVGLGAYPAAVPHTRPTDLASTATSDTLARQVGFVGGSIDVPAGVQAAIETRCADVGLPAVGLWAQVPHYAAAMPFPAAAARLIEGLNDVGGLNLDAGDLVDQGDQARARLDRLVADSDEHQELVQQLENHVDTLASEGPLGSEPVSDLQMQSGEELAAEFQRFLRDQES